MEFSKGLASLINGRHMALDRNSENAQYQRSSQRETPARIA
jgi:hypothetical protein